MGLFGAQKVPNNDHEDAGPLHPVPFSASLPGSYNEFVNAGVEDTRETAYLYRIPRKRTPRTPTSFPLPAFYARVDEFSDILKWLIPPDYVYSYSAKYIFGSSDVTDDSKLLGNGEGGGGKDDGSRLSRWLRLPSAFPLPPVSLSRAGGGVVICARWREPQGCFDAE